MEYTAPGTPQQNGIVERPFATDRDKALYYTTH
jgi:transposase InsO family protein